jgi:SPP1 gp7 family putative phage head morphogenesis protein
MSNPITDILWHLNAEVHELANTGLSDLTEILDKAEVELTRELAMWKALGKGDERFTPQLYRQALTQIRGTLAHIRGPVAERFASVLRHGGIVAGELATDHLIREIETFSQYFEGSIRLIPLNQTKLLAEAKRTQIPKFKTSAARYAGQVGRDIQKQLAVAVVKGETIDQMTKRLAKLGGPRGLVYLKGLPGDPKAKAEYIAEGLFNRYRYYAERLARTEIVNAYNSTALDGMEELEREDPGYYKRWDAAIDKRTCVICAGLDDLVRPLDKDFSYGISQPPAHPNCRCAQVIWRKEWKEHAHKDDVLGKVHEGKEPKGVAAIPHTVQLNKRKSKRSD